MKTKSIWQAACDYETERRGGMATIFNYLSSLHPMTDAAEADLAAAWQRYNEQMNAFARYQSPAPSELEQEMNRPAFW